MFCDFEKVKTSGKVVSKNNEKPAEIAKKLHCIALCLLYPIAIKAFPKVKKEDSEKLPKLDMVKTIGSKFRPSSH